MKKVLLSILAAAGLAGAAVSAQAATYEHVYHRPVVVVKEQHRHWHRPPPPHYYRHHAQVRHYDERR